jgi:hypothetical protein
LISPCPWLSLLLLSDVTRLQDVGFRLAKASLFTVYGATDGTFLGPEFGDISATQGSDNVIRMKVS